MTENRPDLAGSCPIPNLGPLPDDGRGERVKLAHGEGGRLMRQLIQRRITPLISSGREPIRDAAVLSELGEPLAVSTDSFVVSPLFFPGGDIGSLAVYGTVNDLAVAGARPEWITLALILEEGLPMVTLERVLASIAGAATECGVAVIAGDTKVVPRGAADGLFINTTGIGRLLGSPPPGAGAAREGDRLLVSGPIGRHGIAVLSARESLGFEPPPTSDSAPLHPITAALQQSLGSDLRAMRDATRGGLSSVLHEWAEESGLTLQLVETAIPVSPDVRGACELLGLDPLYVANEGTFAAIVAEQGCDRALQVLRSFPHSSQASVVGSVIGRGIAPVLVQRMLGAPQPVDEPSGAPLPRIC